MTNHYIFIPTYLYCHPTHPEDGYSTFGFAWPASEKRARACMFLHSQGEYDLCYQSGQSGQSFLGLEHPKVLTVGPGVAGFVLQDGYPSPTPQTQSQNNILTPTMAPSVMWLSMLGLVAAQPVIPTCSLKETQDCHGRGFSSCCAVQTAFNVTYTPVCYASQTDQCCGWIGSFGETGNSVCSMATSHCDIYHTNQEALQGCVDGALNTCNATSAGLCTYPKACCKQDSPKFKQDNPICFDPDMQICCESYSNLGDSMKWNIQTCEASAQRCDAGCGCMTKAPEFHCCHHKMNGYYETSTVCNAEQSCDPECGCLDAGKTCCKHGDHKFSQCTADEQCSSCGCFNATQFCCDSRNTTCTKGQICDTCGCREQNETCCSFFDPPTDRTHYQTCNASTEVCSNCGCMPSSDHFCCEFGNNHYEHQICTIGTHACDKQCGCLPEGYACCPATSGETPQPFNPLTQTCCTSQRGPKICPSENAVCCELASDKGNVWCCPERSECGSAVGLCQ